MEIKEGYVSFDGYKTYYRIVNPEGKKTPLLLLHGGPGSTHNSFEVLDPLAEMDDRPLIMYDQLGCGKSAIGPHPNLWKADLWARELINLREKLNLKEVHLLGHSWGGMLAIIYLCSYYADGVKSLTLSSTLSSASLWREETHRLIRYLSKADQEAIAKAEKENNYDNLEFQKATEDYLRLFVSGPFEEGVDPACLTRPKEKGTESYLTAWGPSEFAPTGTLKDYEYTDQLYKIIVPVELFSGVNDESTPLQNKTMLEALGSTDKSWTLFAHSRHMSYYEENELYMRKLKAFLDRLD